MTNEYYDILIIGGGAAGMAAALAAEQKGYEKILIAERRSSLGGILTQCVHNGFGLGYFKEDLTGMQYADLFIKMVAESKVTVSTDTTVLKLNPERTALLTGKEGLRHVTFSRCIMATGCRERTLYSQNIAGTRPAGIMTCGTAQKLMNIDGLDIGDNIVILGTGDVGQIVARQLAQQGKRIITMIEQAPLLGGLKRNQESCIRAYSIPVMLNTVVTEIIGESRITGVKVFHQKTGTYEIIPCHTLLTAIGMIPEKELAASLDIQDSLPEWLTFTGNCDYVHDIVDTVTTDAYKLFID